MAVIDDFYASNQYLNWHIINEKKIIQDILMYA
jgi:hypothetical protein